MTNETDLNERFNTAIQRFRKPDSMAHDSLQFTAFDTSRPNFHDNKADFLAEKQLVEQARESADQLFQILYSGMDINDPRY